MAYKYDCADKSSIWSGAKLSDREFDLLEKYFLRYEYAIKTNSERRLAAKVWSEEKQQQKERDARDKPIRSKSVAFKGNPPALENDEISATITEKGIRSGETYTVYRAMAEQFEGTSNARWDARQVPLAYKQSCVISAGSKKMSFGGSRYVYKIFLPQQTPHILREVEPKVFEYLLPRGRILFGGMYDDCDDAGIPVVFLSKDNRNITRVQLLGLLSTIGQTMAPEVNEDVEIDYKFESWITGGGPFRVLEFPWGSERTDLRGEISIYSYKRGR